MSYSWGTTSLRRQERVHPDLRKVITRALDVMDLTVQQHGGDRTPEVQRALFDDDKSTKDGTEKLSRHQPEANVSGYAEAIDLAPYPIKWEDPRRWYYMGGLIIGLGQEMGIPIRWGGDWDHDGEITDQTFHDLGHLELLRT